jgi:hypothetical protein
MVHGSVVPQSATEVSVQCLGGAVNQCWSSVGNKGTMSEQLRSDFLQESADIHWFVALGLWFSL